MKIFVKGHCYLARQTLRDVEARLDGSHFVRVHRSTIINVEQIAELQPPFHGDYEIGLKRGTRVALSRRFRSRILPFLVGARRAGGGIFKMRDIRLPACNAETASPAAHVRCIGRAMGVPARGGTAAATVLARRAVADFFNAFTPKTDPGYCSLR